MRQVKLLLLVVVSLVCVALVVKSEYNEAEYKAIVYNDDSNDNAIYYTAVSVLINLAHLFEDRNTDRVQTCSNNF